MNHWKFYARADHLMFRIRDTLKAINYTDKTKIAWLVMNRLNNLQQFIIIFYKMRYRYNLNTIGNSILLENDFNNT